MVFSTAMLYVRTVVVLDPMIVLIAQNPLHEIRISPIANYLDLIICTN